MRDHFQGPALAASPPLPQAPLGVDPGVHMLTEARPCPEGAEGSDGSLPLHRLQG